MHFASYAEADRRRWFEWYVENARQPAPDAYNWAITLRDTSEVRNMQKAGMRYKGTFYDADFEGNWAQPGACRPPQDPV